MGAPYRLDTPFLSPCVQYVLAMFLAYPLAAIMSLLPKGMARHVFSAVVGLWYAQEIFGVQWIHSFISSLVTYLIVAVAPKKYIATLVRPFTFAHSGHFRPSPIALHVSMLGVIQNGK